MLAGRNVALGVTGSIAAVKCVELAHELRRNGANVQAITTPAAESIIHPWSLGYATDAKPITEITGQIEHVDLCGVDGWADVLLIAPATANTIGKMAAAVDDTPVTTCASTAMGAGCPIVVAPAMHEPMWDHPGVDAAIGTLEDWDVRFVPPRQEEGKAKIAHERHILLETARAAGMQPLADTHVVVTAGATSEPIDPVRVLTSRASGRTGRAVARACYARGATVTLVHDGGDVPFATVHSVEQAAEMRSTVTEAVRDADALVSAAAISDYTVEAVEEKIRSGQADLTLSLTPTPKLLDGVRDAHPDLPIVGFKVESDGDEDRLISAARTLIDRVDAKFVVANAATVMGDTETHALLVDQDDAETFVGSKEALGGRVAERLAEVLG